MSLKDRFSRLPRWARYLIILALVVLLYPPLEAIVYRVRGPYLEGNHINVLNQANDHVVDGAVIVREDVYPFGHLNIGDAEHVRISAYPDTGFQVRVRFLSGKTLTSAEMGYITTGSVAHFFVAISDKEIVLIKKPCSGPVEPDHLALVSCSVPAKQSPASGTSN